MNRFGFILALVLCATVYCDEQGRLDCTADKERTCDGSSMSGSALIGSYDTKVAYAGGMYFYGCTYYDGEYVSMAECQSCEPVHYFSETCQECTTEYKRDMGQCSEGTPNSGAPTQDCAGKGMTDENCVGKEKDRIYALPDNNMWFYQCNNESKIARCAMCQPGLIVDEQCNRCTYFDRDIGTNQQKPCPDSNEIDVVFCAASFCYGKPDGNYEVADGTAANKYYTCAGGYCRDQYCPTEDTYFSKVCGDYGSCQYKYISNSDDCPPAVSTLEPATTVAMIPCPDNFSCERREPGSYGAQARGMYYRCLNKVVCYQYTCPSNNLFDDREGIHICADKYSDYYNNKLDAYGLEPLDY